jgi:hypothetical protein
MSLEQLAERRKFEFEQKAAALAKEFKRWQEQSEENEPFEKHNSQINAIIEHLSPWNEEIVKTLKKYESHPTDIFLKSCKNAVSLILSEHRIWDYFRQKLIQRENESFKKYLRAADEFAWACYQPIQIAAASELKEPPLVFFNGGMSPFTFSRQRTFQAELVDGNDLSTDISNTEILKLPISVVGIPWDQINHLPEATVIGHEVGHIVENDFGLLDDLKKSLDDALTGGDPVRKSAWHAWLSETFADFYGCLCAGPAYAGTLMDYLADDKFSIENQVLTPAKWTSYPTNILRMEFIFQTIETMDFAEEVKSYRDIYRSYKSKMDDLYVEDIKKIVSALYNKKFSNLNNKSLPEVLSFSRKQQDEVIETVKYLRQNNSNSIVPIKSKDIRVIFAAGRYSFELSPPQHVQKIEYQRASYDLVFGESLSDLTQENLYKKDYNDLILDWIEQKVISRGVRAGFTRSSYDEKYERYQKIGKESIIGILKETFSEFEI